MHTYILQNCHRNVSNSCVTHLVGSDCRSELVMNFVSLRIPTSSNPRTSDEWERGEATLRAIGRYVQCPLT